MFLLLYIIFVVNIKLVVGGGDVIVLLSGGFTVPTCQYFEFPFYRNEIYRHAGCLFFRQACFYGVVIHCVVLVQHSSLLLPGVDTVEHLPLDWLLIKLQTQSTTRDGLYSHIVNPVLSLSFQVILDVIALKGVIQPGFWALEGLLQDVVLLIRIFSFFIQKDLEVAPDGVYLEE